MGQYCCCDWKMTPSSHIDMVNKVITTYEVDPDGCTCDWTGWYSIFDWPKERKNKDKPICLPEKEGKYTVRKSTDCGDRYESEAIYCKTPRKECCGYTGIEFEVFWDGCLEDQPYAWKDES